MSDRDGEAAERASCQMCGAPAATVRLDVYGEEVSVCFTCALSADAKRAEAADADEPDPGDDMRPDAAVAALAAENERLTDLVRYQRHELHEAGMITDDEYVALSTVEGSPARLGTYDDLRAENGRMRDVVCRILAPASGFPGGCEVVVRKWEGYQAHTPDGWIFAVSGLTVSDLLAALAATDAEEGPDA